MAIYKKKTFDKCTILGNDVLQSKELSLAARGLLAYMLSLPESWDFTIKGIADGTGESSYQIIKLLKELQSKGYHTKIQLHENGKIKDWVYYIFAEPQQEIIDGTFKDLLKTQDVEIHNLVNNSLNKSISNKLDIYNKQTNPISNKLDIDNSEIYSRETKNNTESKKDIELKENIKCIIDYLNESTNSKFKYDNKQTIRDIKARFKEGYVLDDFYDVIDKKVKEWFNTEMEKYLRPSTLFGNKFENYINQKNNFSGKPKTSYYSSKPSFDNTADHEILKGVAEMTPEERADFEQNELARDENGNLIKF